MSILDIKFYLSILRLRLRYLVGIFVICVGLSIGLAYLLPTVFSASAKILVEEPQIPTELARSTVPLGPVEQLQVIQQQISSRDTLLELAGMLGKESDEMSKPYGESVVRMMRARIGFEQMPLDTHGGGQGTMVFSVSFLADNPDLAAKVANQIATLILDRNQRQRTDQAGNTLQFFDQEVARLGSELNHIDADILKFKTQNRDTLPENLDFRRLQQNSLQDRIISLDREELDQRTRRSNLIATYLYSGQLVGSTPLTPEQQTLASLNGALAEQLAIFSESSPNIHALQARIDALRQKLMVAMPNEGDGKQLPGEGESSSPGLKLQLSDIDDRLAAITAEKSLAAARMDELAQSIAGTAASETALNSMARAQQNLQTQYNAAIARRADASIGEQIEMRSDGGRFSLLEAATAPENRLSPKRGRIVGGGAVAGLALGLAFVALLEFLNDKVRRPSELIRLLQYEPFATVPVLTDVPARSLALIGVVFLAIAPAPPPLSQLITATAEHRYTASLPLDIGSSTARLITNIRVRHGSFAAYS